MLFDSSGLNEKNFAGDRIGVKKRKAGAVRLRHALQQTLAYFTRSKTCMCVIIACNFIQYTSALQGGAVSYPKVSACYTHWENHLVLILYIKIKRTICNLSLSKRSLYLSNWKNGAISKSSYFSMVCSWSKIEPCPKTMIAAALV